MTFEGFVESRNPETDEDYATALAAAVFNNEVAYELDNREDPMEDVISYLTEHSGLTRGTVIGVAIDTVMIRTLGLPFDEDIFRTAFRATYSTPKEVN